jgi:hypothetical protein
MLPERYFFSRTLLLPIKERVSRLIWFDATRGASPPPVDPPALFEIAVRECKDSDPLLVMAAIIVSEKKMTSMISCSYGVDFRCLNIPAVPHNPKPELRIVEPLFRSATASSALLYTFEAPRTITGAKLSFDCGGLLEL